MSHAPQSGPAPTKELSPLAARPAPSEAEPTRVFLVSYPKVVFLYPIFLVSLAAALCLTFSSRPLDVTNTAAVAVSTLFLGVLAINLVVLSFDFPRTTSLTLFFFAVAVVMGFLLLFRMKPELVPFFTSALAAFRPLANVTFYWTIAGVLALIYVVVFGIVQFDYWEIRPNELLHHHGFLSNLERFSAPHLRIDKEINDVFEYMLLRSGRLILQPSSERRAIILDNVPFIKTKEQAITRMLGALQVQVRSDNVQ